MTLITLKKVWSYVRRYGWIILLVGGLIVAAVLTAGHRDMVSHLWSLIRSERDLHKKEIDGLEQLRLEETTRREEASQRAVAAVKAAEAQHRLLGEKLTRKRRKMIEKAAKSGSLELSSELAAQYGLDDVSKRG